jgi:hypothetical protein
MATGYYGDTFSGAQSAALADEARRSGRELQFAQMLQQGAGSASSKALSILGMLQSEKRAGERNKLDTDYLNLQKEAMGKPGRGDLAMESKQAALDAESGTFDKSKWKNLSPDLADAFERRSKEVNDQLHDSHGIALGHAEWLNKRDKLREDAARWKTFLDKGGDNDFKTHGIWSFLPGDTAAMDAARKQLEADQKELTEIGPYASRAEEWNKTHKHLVLGEDGRWRPAFAPPKRVAPPQAAPQRAMVPPEQAAIEDFKRRNTTPGGPAFAPSRQMMFRGPENPNYPIARDVPDMQPGQAGMQGTNVDMMLPPIAPTNAPNGRALVPISAESEQLPEPPPYPMARDIVEPQALPPGTNAPGVSRGGANRTQRQVITIQDSTGKTHTIFADMLQQARTRDPGLQVLQ